MVGYELNNIIFTKRLFLKLKAKPALRQSETVFITDLKMKRKDISSFLRKNLIHYNKLIIIDKKLDNSGNYLFKINKIEKLNLKVYIDDDPIFSKLFNSKDTKIFNFEEAVKLNYLIKV